MPTIYPILKPFDWTNKALVEHGAVFLDVEKAPLIAFGFDAGDHYQFVQKGEVNDFKALFAEGLKNLAALDYAWELCDAGGLRFAASSGKEFSAERVLDCKAMLSWRLVASKPLVRHRVLSFIALMVV